MLKKGYRLRFLIINMHLTLLFCVSFMNVSCVKGAMLTIIEEPLTQDHLEAKTTSYIVFSDDYYTADPNDTTSACIDWSHPALDEMRRRAHLIGGIEWTPLKEVPKREGVFTAGKTYKGIPYSSVKDTSDASLSHR